MDVFESPKIRPFNTIYWTYEPSVIISNVKIYSLMIYLYFSLSLSLYLSVTISYFVTTTNF